MLRNASLFRSWVPVHPGTGLLRISKRHERSDARTNVKTLETFSTVREGKIFLQSCDKLTERVAMTGFKRAYSLAVSEIRSSPHILNAGVVSSDLAYLAVKVAQSGLSDKNFALVLEGLGRLEISCVDFLSENPRHESLVHALTHCCRQGVQSSALSTSFLNLILNKRHEVSNSQLLEYLPLLASLSYGGNKVSTEMSRFLRRRFYGETVATTDIPALTVFCARAGYSLLCNDILEAYHNDLLLRPDVLLKIAGHCRLPPALQHHLVHHLQLDVKQFPAADLADAVRAFGSAIPQALETEMMLAILSKANQLSCKQLVSTMYKACKINMKPLPAESALECISFLCMHMEQLDAKDLCIALEFAELFKIDVENFVRLACIEVTERISFMVKPQSKLLPLLRLIKIRDMKLRCALPDNNGLRILADILTSTPLRPLWVYADLVEFLNGGNYLLSNLVSMVGSSALCHLPSTFLQGICKVAVDSRVPLLVLPFVNELVSRVDEVESAIDMLLWMSEYVPLSSNESIWKQIVERTVASKLNDSQPPEKWLGLLLVLSGNELSQLVGQHIVSLVQSGSVQWPVRSVVEAIISLASANITCLEIVTTLSQMPNVVQSLEVLPVHLLGNLVYSCGRLGFVVPQTLREPILADRYNVFNKINLYWALIAGNSKDVDDDCTSLLQSISAGDLKGASNDIIQRLQQLHTHSIIKKGASAALRDDTARFVSSKLIGECYIQADPVVQDLATRVRSQVGEDYVLYNCTTAGGGIVDVALQLDGNNQLVAWQDKGTHTTISKKAIPLAQRTSYKNMKAIADPVMQRLPASDGVRRFALLVIDEKKHHVAGSKRMVGESVLRVLALQSLGWHVIKVLKKDAAEFCLFDKIGISKK
ncbi:uncharacterized protein LOC135806379 [Sycon ciliatum]|uniref:uncharacterized protein LOC135806379 n=1 Tax=Sycon ciliatum TaxID=27933 RepID=UPI0020AA5115|eukprot:scpid33955/ scgid14825/ 